MESEGRRPPASSRRNADLSLSPSGGPVATVPSVCPDAAVAVGSARALRPSARQPAQGRDLRLRSLPVAPGVQTCCRFLPLINSFLWKQPFRLLQPQPRGSLRPPAPPAAETTTTAMFGIWDAVPVPLCAWLESWVEGFFV